MTTYSEHSALPGVAKEMHISSEQYYRNGQYDQRSNGWNVSAYDLRNSHRQKYRDDDNLEYEKSIFHPPGLRRSGLQGQDGGTDGVYRCERRDQKRGAIRTDSRIKEVMVTIKIQVEKTLPART